MNSTVDFFEGLIHRVPLQDNEKEVLIGRMRGKPLAEIAASLGRSRERVRQLEKRALKKLQEPSRLGVHFLEGQDRIAWLLDQLGAHLQAAEDDREESEPIVADARLEVLGIPTRTLRSLRRGGITTVGQLMRTEDATLLELSHFGKESLRRVRERVARLLS